MFKALWKFITIFKYRVIAVGKVKCVHNGIYLAVYMMNGLGKRKFRFISQKQDLRYIQRGMTINTFTCGNLAGHCQRT